MLPRMAPSGFDAALASADVVLDSLDWSGCNTLVTALDFGLPIVATPGRFMRGRHGAGLLSVLGLSHWVQRDEGAYIALASDLANDTGLRARFAAEVRDTRSHLYGVGSAAISALETFLIDSVVSAD